ncbi:MAG: M20/M25/M40 family metallo-hydrolase [Gemmatimonadetes bacterium]|uniref:M20/M25/M40 family metallo-hydrolase n=1 Tax=Candidatus Kutchimonas denitrificans TaxID=3056748 RepID=A0AAE4ZA38_9BACT|nr:M20/M25/M40 family metallo-hydrolase [Gemmatimonadota bacterium]NIR74336.1 M20/M25/M40 family metallo-hydrolase [Candidatus Kutchimonas denitrificans]NIS02587.1 M20/M25/M40 family metallo-hydrolase [Gemmatimonadota bacterium]NIT68462.1 M20/M25/M40 family metallo-hydrolase [Gemmatimonadota bacterium]NIU51939.1 M20/M25/M40 family metallo-hydrolase [Gemmatimonadota bacterium]
MKRTPIVVTILALSLAGAEAHAQSDAIRAVRSYRQANEAAIVQELVDFLRIPNVAYQSDMRRNVDALIEMMERRGIAARVLETPGVPYVYGQLNVPGARHTVLFYAHYDGQPVDPDRWVGHAPFEPILRDGSLAVGGEPMAMPADGALDPDWRLFARSASDDKSPIVAMMVALDALRASGREPRANLKFIFEGDEEAGSPHLGYAVQRYGDLLAADLVVSADGPADPSGLPTLYFGARGIVGAEITVYGPLRPLHSGHYGNWAPNPALRLAQLLATMKDPATGRVLVDGFYDDVVPLSERELAAIAAAPNDDQQQMMEFGIPEPEIDEPRLLAINQPSLNIRGLRSGWVGEEARTIVPDVAIASIDLRLVEAIDPQEQLRRLIRHIEERGYHIVSEDPDRDMRRRHERLAKVTTSDGYPAFRTPMDLPVARELVAAVEGHTGVSVVKLPTLGGSVPLYQFTDGLGIPTVGVPIVNHDNNQHSPNENLRLGNLWQGIETLAAAMLIE